MTSILGTLCKKNRAIAGMRREIQKNTAETVE